MCGARLRSGALARVVFRQVLRHQLAREARGACARACSRQRAQCRAKAPQASLPRSTTAALRMHLCAARRGRGAPHTMTSCARAMAAEGASARVWDGRAACCVGGTCLGPRPRQLQFGSSSQFVVRCGAQLVPHFPALRARPSDGARRHSWAATREAAAPGVGVMKARRGRRNDDVHATTKMKRRRAQAVRVSHARTCVMQEARTHARAQRHAANSV